MFKAALGAIKGKYEDNAFVARLKNKEFMEGACAGCALVALGDGDVGDAEMERFSDLCDNSNALKHFDKDKLYDEFERYCKKAKFSKREVWKELKDVPADLHPNIIDMMVSMAESDDEIGEAEEKIVRKAIQEYGLNPKEWLG